MSEYLGNTIIHATVTERTIVENNINDVTVNLDPVTTEVPANFVLLQLGASGIPITTPSSMTATNVQTALEELADEYYHKQAGPPSSPNEGDIWYDTDDNVLQLYRNSAWVTMAGATGTDMSTFSGGTY